MADRVGTADLVGRAGEQLLERLHLADLDAADIAFWRVWYFGSIPWQRETVTPASVLHTPGLRTVFDGIASRDNPAI
jgi:hypothetical protein